jgi:hypothetical protein
MFFQRQVELVDEHGLQEIHAVLFRRQVPLRFVRVALPGVRGPVRLAQTLVDAGTQSALPSIGSPSPTARASPRSSAASRGRLQTSSRSVP